MDNLVTIDIAVIRLAKEVRDHQKRYLYLVNNAHTDAKLIAERKEVLISCKSRERELDKHLDNILAGPPGSKPALGYIQFEE